VSSGQYAADGVSAKGQGRHLTRILARHDGGEQSGREGCEKGELGGRPVRDIDHGERGLGGVQLGAHERPSQDLHRPEVAPLEERALYRLLEEGRRKGPVGAPPRFLDAVSQWFGQPWGARQAGLCLLGLGEGFGELLAGLGQGLGHRHRGLEVGDGVEAQRQAARDHHQRGITGRLEKRLAQTLRQRRGRDPLGLGEGPNEVTAFALPVLIRVGRGRWRRRRLSPLGLLGFRRRGRRGHEFGEARFTPNTGRGIIVVPNHFERAGRTRRRCFGLGLLIGRDGDGASLDEVPRGVGRADARGLAPGRFRRRAPPRGRTRRLRNPRWLRWRIVRGGASGGRRRGRRRNLLGLPSQPGGAVGAAGLLDDALHLGREDLRVGLRAGAFGALRIHLEGVVPARRDRGRRVVGPIDGIPVEDPHPNRTRLIGVGELDLTPPDHGHDALVGIEEESIGHEGNRGVLRLSVPRDPRNGAPSRQARRQLRPLGMEVLEVQGLIDADHVEPLVLRRDLEVAPVETVIERRGVELVLVEGAPLQAIPTGWPVRAERTETRRTIPFQGQDRRQVPAIWRHAHGIVVASGAQLPAERSAAPRGAELHLIGHPLPHRHHPQALAMGTEPDPDHQLLRGLESKNRAHHDVLRAGLWRNEIAGVAKARPRTVVEPVPRYERHGRPRPAPARGQRLAELGHHAERPLAPARPKEQRTYDEVGSFGGDDAQESLGIVVSVGPSLPSRGEGWYTSAVSLQEGDPVGEQLTLAEPISEGATSVIWRAYHRGLKAHVAVKVMRAERNTHPVANIRFVEEARVAAQLRHPNILRVFDQGLTDDGDRFIVMELLEGQTLGQRLREGPLSMEEAIHVMDQTGKALAAAHAQGVVHRDVKVANLFLCDDEPLPFVKLLDFGLAKRLAVEGLDLTATGSLLGTLPYMSPEQLAGEHVDARADQWALAVVAYTALTGKRPFATTSIAGLMQAQRAGAYTPVRALQPEVPPAVDDWFATAFEPAIEARHPNVQTQLRAWREAWGRPARLTSAPPAARAAEQDQDPWEDAHRVGTDFVDPGNDGSTTLPVGAPPRRWPFAAAAVVVTLAVGWQLHERPKAAHLEPQLPVMVTVAAIDAATTATAAIAVPTAPAPAVRSVPTLDGPAARPPSPRDQPPPPGPAEDNTDERIEQAGEQLGI